MEEQDARLRHLERQVRRLRRAVNVMAVGLLGCAGAFTLGAATEPQELTLRKLTIVDAEGKVRIEHGTIGGVAYIKHFDPDEKLRIAAGTLPDGHASIGHFDLDGNKRIAAGTLPGGKAGITLFDRNGKKRIEAGTLADGRARIGVADRDGLLRIGAATVPDGQAVIRLNDRKGEATWGETSQ